MAEIEAEPAIHDRVGPLLLGAAGLHIVAAVLAVVAPFLDIWTVRIRSALDQAAGTASETSTTGWGSSSAPGSHGPIYGLILTLAALPLAASAAALLRESARRRALSVGSGAEPARSLGVAGSGLLLGGTGACLLVAVNIADNADRLGGNGTADASIGPGVWLALTAWVASALAIAVSEAAHRRTRRALDDELDRELAELEELDDEV